MKTRRTVQVLLLEDAEALGEVGSVVDVTPGHARNFLFPTGVACPVTPDALRRVEKARRDAATKRRRRAAELAALGEALEGVSITLEERASEEGHLFGSVGVTAIAAGLAAQEIRVEEKQVLLEEPIKELGIFNVPIRLDSETTAEIRVWVVEPA